MAQPQAEMELRAWLDALAAGTPAPGGGAVAALSAAGAAALVAMTCRVTIGRPAYAEAEDLLEDVLEDAEQLRLAALELMDEDGRAYGKVIAASRMPKSREEEKAARRTALDDALVGAAGVPLQVAKLAATLVGIADRIRPHVNRNALEDLEAAAIAARSALDISLMNARTNLSLVSGQDRCGNALAELQELERTRRSF